MTRGAPVVAMGLVAALWLSGARPALAQAVEAEEAVVIAPGGGRLDAGGSATEFTLALPDDAQCPGDSAFEGWRVNGYMVPASVDVATLTYDGLGPAPAGLVDYSRFRQPLYDTETSPYASALTAAVQERGDPGLIVDIPTFSLGVYSPGDVPAGRYHVGIACTLLNEVGRVWDAEIVITEAPDDDPAQLRWRFIGAQADGSGPELPTDLISLAVVAAALSTLALHRRRRASRPLSASGEGAS
jgi:hypothetical protein